MLQKYEDIEKYFNALNKDLTHFSNSNDICTPIGCVKEMVDEIPDEFWKRKDIKILDPCAGNGNFPAYITTKTDLKNIYFNELNPKRIANLKTYFGDNINLTTYDFLEYPENEKFDLIIANPPFAKFTTEGTRAAKNHSLSREFVIKSLKLLKEDGYLVYILPNNWMSYSDRNTIPYQLSNLTILTINIGEVEKWFPTVGSSFTYFVVKNTPNLLKETKIIMKDKTVYAVIDKGVPCIPLEYNSIIHSIFQKVVFSNDEKYNVQTSSNLHKYTKANLLSNEKDDKHQYRIIHTPNQTVWAERPHIYQEGWKVFLPTTTYYHPYIDNDCGMTQSIAFVLCKNEDDAKQKCEELSNPLYKTIIALTNYGNFNNERIMQHLSLLKNIQLTQEEENFINNYPYK